MRSDMATMRRQRGPARKIEMGPQQIVNKKLLKISLGRGRDPLAASMEHPLA
jgi:hypothetical protein